MDTAALIAKLLFPLAVTLGGVAPLAAQEHEEHSKSASSHASEGGYHKPKPTDYARYRQYFIDLCEEIDADGRKPFMYGLLLKISEKDPACIDCRPLLNALVTACKPKVTRDLPTPIPVTEEGAEPTAVIVPTPTPLPGRLPNVAAIDILVEMVRAISSDKAHIEEGLKAFDKLKSALLNEEGKTAGEREYSETLATYMEAPLTQVRAELEAARKAEAAHAAPQDEADQQFKEAPSKGTEGLFEK